jgi:hypothetical protein
MLPSWSTANKSKSKLIANTVDCIMQKTEDVYATYKLTDEDLAEIHTLARDPKIGAFIMWH